MDVGGGGPRVLLGRDGRADRHAGPGGRLESGRAGGQDREQERILDSEMLGVKGIGGLSFGEMVCGTPGLHARLQDQ